MKIKLPRYNVLILIVLAIISAAIRLYINYSTEFIPGAVGAFYLVQVRSIIETGALAFREFPLLFYLEVALAKFIMSFSSINIGAAVDHACRIFDAIIPPVSILPAYLLIKKLSGKKNTEFLLILISAFSIYYISFFSLVSDYQKNSLGLLWLFCAMLYTFQILSQRNAGNYFFFFLFFALTGLTHFGSFAVEILFLSVVFTVNYFKNFTIKRLMKFLLELIVVLSLGLGTIYFLSPDRFILLINSPMEIFIDPIIISVLTNKDAVSAVDLANITFINFIAVLGLVILLYNKNKIETPLKIFVASAIVMCLILASPFLGLEWGQRLYLISYVFTIPIMTFILKIINKKIQKNIAAALMFIVLFMSVVAAIATPQFSNMNKESYSELIEIKKILPQKESKIIIARLGLHYWAAWSLKTMVALEDDVSKNWWGHINYIYYLKQEKNIVPFGTAGLYGRPFADPKTPCDSEIVFSGKYYTLYRAITPPGYLKK